MVKKNPMSLQTIHKKYKINLSEIEKLTHDSKTIPYLHLILYVNIIQQYVMRSKELFVQLCTRLF